MDNLPNLKNLVNQVKDFLEKNKLLNQKYIMNGFILFLIYYILFDKAIEIITFIISLIYPSYMTFKSLQNQKKSLDLKKWSIYWIFFSFVNLFEQIAWLTINFIPMYHLIKLSFILWLFNCNFNTIDSIYKKSIFLFLDKNKEYIDQQLNIIHNKVEKLRIDFGNLLLHKENEEKDN
tara:strand:+ start:895 stop:1425 length:531 start_codon:yes stop_codon:yes gene_type:complete